jgi:hypothetical protein
MRTFTTLAVAALIAGCGLATSANAQSFRKGTAASHFQIAGDTGRGDAKPRGRTFHRIPSSMSAAQHSAHAPAPLDCSIESHPDCQPKHTVFGWGSSMYQYAFDRTYN